MTDLHRALAWATGLRLTRLSLRTAGFRRTITLLGRVPASRRSEAADPDDAVRWAEAIRRVSGRPYGGTCLDRSVLLWFLARRHGLPARIRVGVADDGGDVVGHAWIEIDGRVVNDDPSVAERFAVFEDDPAGLVFL
jgi:hypothetical protein